MKHIFLSALAVAFIFVAVFLWYRWALRAIDPLDSSRSVVRIERGMGVSEISQLLKKEGLIRSAGAFVLYVRFHEVDRGLRAGSVVIRRSLSVPEIVDVLQSSVAEEAVIAVPEGWTVREMDALLVEKGLIKEGELLTCAKMCDFSSFNFLPLDFAHGLATRGGLLEGYLFPDTYFVLRDDFVPKFFLERLLSTFRRNVIDVFGDDVHRSGHTLHEVMIMASLIEEETRSAEERAMVSGILWKRFDDGRGLDVDASVRYILGKATGALTGEDLRVNSPYNTRKFRGLPPGPIANPGLASIKAALHPKESSYWYYLHGKDGRIHYAETNEEHNENKYKYLH